MKHETHHSADAVTETTEGIPPSKFSGSNTVRKRGGQPGNTNRLRHGGFSREAQARRDWVRALVAETDALILRIEMVGRARKVLKAKQLRLTSPFVGR